jgi:hypothetical protein
MYTTGPKKMLQREELIGPADTRQLSLDHCRLFWVLHFVEVVTITDVSRECVTPSFRVKVGSSNFLRNHDVC